MSLVPNLRVAGDKSEIIEVLTRIYVKESPILIWQRENDQKRLLNTAKIAHIDSTVGVMHLKSTSGKWLAGIKGELSLYFKGEVESILFKSKNIILKRDELVVPIPSEVRLLEKRDQPRLRFDGQGKGAMKFLVQKIFENGLRKVFSVPILDVSITGMAFRIPKTDGNFFYEGDSLYVIQIGNTRLKDSVLGKVVYLKPVSFKENGMSFKGFRVGVKFARYLTSDHTKLFNKS